MTYKLNDLKEMIPIHLNGRLSKSKNRLLERGMRKYPALKDEMMEYSKIKASYKDIEEESPLHSDILYKEIVKNISSLKGQNGFLEKESYMERLWIFLKDLFVLPQVSWTVVGVQVLIILALLFSSPVKKGYNTLSSGDGMIGEGIKMNIVFKADAQEYEIRRLLGDVGAGMVAGPTPEGLYILRIRGNRDIAVVTADLKNSGIVEFVGRAF